MQEATHLLISDKKQMSPAIFGARVSWPASITNSLSIEQIPKQNCVENKKRSKKGNEI